MNARTLNILIGAAALSLVAMVFWPTHSNEPEEYAETDDPDSVQEEVIEEDSRMLDGHMPINWQDTSLREARQKAREQRYAEQFNDAPPKAEIGIIEFEQMRKEQISEMEKNLQRRNDDDQDASLSTEDLEKMKADGVAIW